MKNIFTLFLLAFVGVACAQQPAINLSQLETSKTVEGTKAGQFGLTDTNGKQRYAQYTEINPGQITYFPTPTGNTMNISEFVMDPDSNIWYIDWQGRGLEIYKAGGGGIHTSGPIQGDGTVTNPVTFVNGDIIGQYWVWNGSGWVLDTLPTDKNGYYGGNGGNGGDGTIPSNTHSVVTDSFAFWVPSSAIGGTAPINIISKTPGDFEDYLKILAGPDSLLIYRSDQDFTIQANGNLQWRGLGGVIIKADNNSIKLDGVLTDTSQHTFLRITPGGIVKKAALISWTDLSSSVKDSIQAGGDVFTTVFTASPLAGNGAFINPVRLEDGTLAGQHIEWNGTDWELDTLPYPYNTAFTAGGALGDVSITDNHTTLSIPTLDIAPVQSLTSPNGTIAIGSSPGGVKTLDLAQQSATLNQVLAWNGTKFAPTSPGAASSLYTGSGTIPSNTVATNSTRFSFPFRLAFSTAYNSIYYNSPFAGFYASDGTNIAQSGVIDIGDYPSIYAASTDGTNTGYFSTGAGITAFGAKQVGSGYSNFIQSGSDGLQLYADNDQRFLVSDFTNGKKGLQYETDNSDSLLSNLRSIGDIGTIRKLFFAGSGITLTPVGDTIEIAATGGGGNPSIYTSSGEAINGGVARTKDFVFVTDSTPGYNIDNFYAPLIFDGGHSWADGSYNNDLFGQIAIEAGHSDFRNNWAASGFSQLLLNGEEQSATLAGAWPSHGHQRNIFTTSPASLNIQCYNDTTGVQLRMDAHQAIFTDQSSGPYTKKGIQYGTDISQKILHNYRSLADVGTVRKVYVAGSNITLTPVGDSTLSISATGGGITSVITDNRTITGTGVAGDSIRLKPGTAPNQYLKYTGTTWTKDTLPYPYNTAFTAGGALGDVSITDNHTTLSIPTLDIAPVQSLTSPNGTIAIGSSPGGVKTLDLAQQSATLNQVLAWNGTKFAPASPGAASSLYTGSGTVPTHVTATLTNDLKFAIPSTTSYFPFVLNSATHADFENLFKIQSGDSLTVYKSDTDWDLKCNKDFVVQSLGAQTLKGASVVINSTGNSIKLTGVSSDTSVHVFLKKNGSDIVKSSDHISYSDLATAVKDSINSKSSGEKFVVLGSDVATGSTSFADVTGLSFAVASGGIYYCKFTINYDAAATTTGSAFAINGPAGNVAISTIKASTAITSNVYFQNARDQGTASSASPYTSGNIAYVEGLVYPSASGTYILRFLSEVSSSNITVKAGSFLTYKKLN